MTPENLGPQKFDLPPTPHFCWEGGGDKIIENNHDAQNNLEPDTSQTFIYTTTSLKDATKVKCDTICEALEPYETSENVKAQQPEHKCDTMKHETIKESDVEKETSENCEFESLGSLSTSNSTVSAALTKRDLEDMWKIFAECNGYRTWNTLATLP